MSYEQKVPRIVQLMKVDRFKVHCAFNNGESRVVDFEELFETEAFQNDPFLHRLTDPEQFEKLELKNGTLAWPHITKTITLSNGMVFETPLELDPVVLFEG